MTTRDITVFVRLYGGGANFALTEDEIKEQTFFEDIVPSEIAATAYTECRYRITMTVPSEGTIEKIAA